MEARKAKLLGEEKQEGEKTKIGLGVGESRKKIATFRKEEKVIRPIGERECEDKKLKNKDNESGRREIRWR